MTATVLLIWKDLTRIENAVGVEGRLHAPHQRDFVARQLQPEIGPLREPDTVLAADRSFEPHDPFEETPDRLVAAPSALDDLVVVPRVGHHDVDVDVSVSGMA